MKSEKSPFDRKSYRRLLLLATVFLPVALLLNLGIAPLMLEEPRRGLVTMEMLHSGNIWVPHLFGELYYNKPPVFNWVLMGSAAVMGELNEWALRLPTVLSLIGMGLLTYISGRRFVSPVFGWLAGLLTICSADLLFYFSLLGEIDLFYSLLTYGSILAVFFFHQKEQPYRLFLCTYLLAAAGFLTKGLPSVLFAGLTLVAYLGYRRAWRYLFSAEHLTGILSFLLVVTAYYAIYAQYEDPWPFLRNIWASSANRSPLGESWLEIPQHLISFPPDTFKNLLPAAFLIVFGLQKSSWKSLWRQPLMQFALIAFTVNYVVYWISPGSRQRYIYMLFPLAILVLSYLYYQRADFHPGQRFLQVIGLLGSAVVALAAITLPFLSLDNLPGLPLWLGVALFAGGSALFVYLFPRPELSLPAIILVLVLSRLFFDLTILPQRAQHSDPLQEQNWARQVTLLSERAPIYLVNGHRAPFTFTFYLNQYRNQLLGTVEQYRENSYYILDNQEPPGWRTLTDYNDQEECYYFGFFTVPPDPAFFREREMEKAILTD